jgi:hypothetical protein
VFLGQYLTNDIQQAFDFALIAALPVDEAVREALREEARGLAYPINHQHPLLGNILRFLRSSSMLESACVQDALRDYLP